MRDILAAATTLMNANFAGLDTIIRRDPDMIRDVAAALIHARTPPGPGCGAIDCVNACDGGDDYKYCSNAIAARAR